MPYVVQRVQSLYEDADEQGRDGTAEELLAEFLTRHEGSGFRLVGVVPDQQVWDADGQPVARAGTLLVLHKERPEGSGRPRPRDV